MEIELFDWERRHAWNQLSEFVISHPDVKEATVIPFCRYEEIGTRESGIYTLKKFGVTIRWENERYAEFVLAYDLFREVGLCELHKHVYARDQLEAMSYGMIIVAYLRALLMRTPDDSPNVYLGGSDITSQIQRYVQFFSDTVL